MWISPQNPSFIHNYLLLVGYYLTYENFYESE